MRVGHAHGLHAHVEDGVGQQAQANLAHHHAEARIVVEEAFVHHHLGAVFGPAFDVSAVAEKSAQQAARFGLDVVGVLGLHVVAGQTLREGESHFSV